MMEAKLDLQDTIRNSLGYAIRIKKDHAKEQKYLEGKINCVWRKYWKKPSMIHSFLIFQVCHET